MRLLVFLSLCCAGCGDSRSDSADAGFDAFELPDSGTDTATRDAFIPDAAEPDAGVVALRFDNPCLADVPAAFDAIGSGADLRAWSGTVDDAAGPMPWPRYTDSVANGLGINNHFQGVQRLRSNPYLIVTGGDVAGETGHVFLLHLASKNATTRWGSNLDSGSAPSSDRIVERMDALTHWHAGGPAALGDLVAIPLENDGISTIEFYDLRDPLDPRLVTMVDRDDAQASAVALTRLADERILMAARTDALVDFYVSQTEDVTDGFGAPVRWNHERGSIFGDFANSQNINLLRQCDGTIYLAGFWSSSPGIPLIPGSDEGVLFELTFPDGDPAQLPAIDEVASRSFNCAGSCNFDAAAGLFVTDAGELILYGTRHYRETSGTESYVRVREL